MNQNILIKGARKFAFEKIAERLKLKTHQTSLEVNLSRLKWNLDNVKQSLGRDTRVMAMVKALGYGSGGYQIAKLLETNNSARKFKVICGEMGRGEARDNVESSLC